MNKEINYTFALAAIAALTLFLPVASQVQEKVSAIGQELQQKAVQYVQEGNFSASHLDQELKDTKNDLMQQASEQLN
jgi:hypothetical protein